MLADRAREAGVPCAVHVHDIREMDHLIDLGTDYLMISKVDGLKRLNTKLKELASLPTARND
jgi:indole-3-glycerol phosphate synthase